MTRRRLLVAASAAQLACGLTGLAVAIARKRPYDLPLLQHGDPDRVKRDAMTLGTPLSAPAAMLALQSVAVMSLAARPDPRATRALGVLGSVMTAGYLMEKLVRQRLTPAGWDPVETPIAVLGLTLAAAMAAFSFAGATGATDARALNRW